VSKRRQVFVTDGAERDLEEIHEYLCAADSPEVADRIQDRLLGLIGTLGQLSERGSIPRELLALGMRDYHQLVLAPWRVIYQVAAAGVFVLLVADGRRDMKTLLARRLLNPWT
jgi:toxin ParE1/3/4